MKNFILNFIIILGAIILGFFGFISNTFALGQDIRPKVSFNGSITFDNSFTLVNSLYYSNYQRALNWFNSSGKSYYVIYPDNFKAGINDFGYGSNQINIIAFNEVDVYNGVFIGGILHKNSAFANPEVLSGIGLFSASNSSILPHASFYNTTGIKTNEPFQANYAWYNASYISNFNATNYSTYNHILTNNYSLKISTNFPITFLNNINKSNLLDMAKSIFYNNVFYNQNDIIFNADGSQNMGDPFKNYTKYTFQKGSAITLSSGNSSELVPIELYLPYGVVETTNTEIWTYSKTYDMSITHLPLSQFPVVEMGGNYYYYLSASFKFDEMYLALSQDTGSYGGTYDFYASNNLTLYTVDPNKFPIWVDEIDLESFKADSSIDTNVFSQLGGVLTTAIGVFPKEYITLGFMSFGLMLFMFLIKNML